MKKYDATELAFKNGYKQGKYDTVQNIMDILNTMSCVHSTYSLENDTVVSLSDILQILKKITEE